MLLPEAWCGKTAATTSLRRGPPQLITEHTEQIPQSCRESEAPARESAAVSRAVVQSVQTPITIPGARTSFPHLNQGPWVVAAPSDLTLHGVF